MKPNLSSLVRSGLIALGVLAGVSAPALALPAAAPLQGMTPATENTLPLIKVGSGEWEPGCPPGSSCFRRGGGGGGVVIRQRDREFRQGWNRPGNWERPRRNWDRPRWRNNESWRYRDDRWRYRHHRPRPYYGGYDDYYGGSGIYFNFSAPSYRYVEPRYRYVQPRRYQRARLSRAHVNWCYNRYRSYRAYDNTFQPYGGPRQQCWSPYS
ncbi:BA14K family protein [Mesorhizobium sp. YR577]|jgi:hypothetical protein|uniref:BA14K family protein n=1 Tax=Mesorhizobium sp. YR577 TaxID=1884373 RepID=UPI0008F0F2B4|nr:BA14K family protein [Mesorhizobium sp. YR577]SFU03643.1 BA14K-like protein [Mesorhizobium sp. YR577]